MKRIKITEAQAKLLKNLSEGDEIKFNPQLKPTAQIKKNFEKETKGLGLKFESQRLDEGITMELIELAQEVIDFVRQVYTDPSTKGLSPFWKEMGMNAGEVKELLTDVGLMSMATFKGASYLGKKDVVGKMRKLYKKLRQLIYKKKQEKVQNTYKTDMEEASNLPPGVSDNDPHFNPPATKRPIEVRGPFETVFYNKEIAILKGPDSNTLYGLYYADEDLSDYAEREVMGTYKDEEGMPYDEYHEDFDIDDETIDAYVNDNYTLEGVGQGLDSFDNGNLTVIDEEMKAEILDYWNEPKLEAILGGMEETTTAASSGAYVGRLNDKPTIDRDRFPSEELDETTDWAQVAGESGTFAYDAPAGDGDDFWTAGNKMNKKMNKNGTVSEDAKKDTQWPDGAFVEMPACSKLDNNKEAQNGGCNQGAGVKFKTSKDSVISDAQMYKEVAEKTGRSISEVINIVNNYKNK